MKSKALMVGVGVIAGLLLLLLLVLLWDEADVPFALTESLASLRFFRGPWGVGFGVGMRRHFRVLRFTLAAEGGIIVGAAGGVAAVSDAADSLPPEVGVAG